MPEILVGFMICLFGLVAFVMFLIICTGIDISGFSSKDKYIFLGVFCLFISIFICSIKWINSGDVKLDHTDYILIQRNGDIKYYIYEGKIIQTDRSIDDKEYCIKKDFYVSNWCNGIYYHMNSGIRTSIVPKKEITAEVK